MPIVNSRQSLIEYAFRRLGAPVVQINVDPDQIEDRLDDALQYFQEYHSDATITTYLRHEVTQENIDNGYIDALDDKILSIHNIFPFTDQGVSGDALFDVKYQLHLNDIYDLNRVGDIVTYDMLMQYMSLIDLRITGRNEHIRFNRHMNRLYIDMDWKRQVTVGDYIIIQCTFIVDPETYTDIYGDRYLKEYFTELIQYQWGVNITKFDGMLLPGNVTLNGRQKIEDAERNLERLRREIRENYEMPPGFLIG